MILTHLLRHWGRYGPRDGFAPFLLRGLRSLRVLRYWRAHRQLCALPTVRDYVAPAAPHDVFHHLTERGYLMRGLSAGQRVHAALTHYRFEEATFDQAYKQAVYRAGGLRLWQQTIAGSTFFIRLEMAVRLDAEGDLTIALVAQDKVLHRLSFSWLGGSPVTPFIARNQGRWTDSDAAFAAFEAAFPGNSPSYFCFAALQGVALALGIHRVLAVRSGAHIAWGVNAAPHFVNAYDKFWAQLGGVVRDDAVVSIALPHYVKPLDQMPSRHRKRAVRRRANWRLIGDSAGAVILRHRLHAATRAPLSADA